MDFPFYDCSYNLHVHSYSSCRERHRLRRVGNHLELLRRELGEERHLFEARCEARFRSGDGRRDEVAKGYAAELVEYRAAR